MDQTDNGAPDAEEVTRITNKVVDVLGECDLVSAMTVMCNLTGQMVASLSNGNFTAVERHAQSVAENVKMAARTKLIHDMNKKQAAQRKLKKAQK